MEDEKTNTVLLATNDPETVESIAEDITDSVSPFVDFATETVERLTHQLTTMEGLYQLGALLVGLAIAWLSHRPITGLVSKLWPEVSNKKPFLGNLFRSFKRVLIPLVWVALLWITIPLFRQNLMPNDMLRIVASMLQAWIVITLFSTVVRDPAWSRTFAAVAWFVAALYIMRLLNPAIAFLDGIGVSFGESRLSIYDMLKGTVLLVLLIWVATQVSKLAHARLQQSKSLNPSMRSLVSQLVRLGTLFFAAMIALNAIGVDLTALAVFSGAVGVGIGFGLQAIFSNLMSGAIMLIEGSVSVGDFVELESGVTGEVKEINTRATLITTNDRVDILVPNSQFINGTVTNWTLREKHRRTRIPFGVAYGTDKDLVKKAALEAAASLPHELKGKDARAPEVWLVGFGESSLDFELVLWLHPDAVKRPMAVLAEYNWAIETALKKYNIEIPFPQRDLHIRSGLAATS